MELVVIATPEGPVIRVRGDLAADDAAELDRCTRGLLAGREPVAIELGGLGALSAPGLAVLVQLVETATASGADLRLVGARQSIARLIDAGVAGPRPGGAPMTPESRTDRLATRPSG